MGSTRGSSLQPILYAIQDGRLNAEISVVVSNVASSYILQRARVNNLKTVHVPGKGRVREAIRARGMAAHAPFGTWLLEDEPDAVCIRHLHGRKFMTDTQRAARVLVFFPEARSPSAAASLPRAFAPRRRHSAPRDRLRTNASRFGAEPRGSSRLAR